MYFLGLCGRIIGAQSSKSKNKVLMVIQQKPRSQTCEECHSTAWDPMALDKTELLRSVGALLVDGDLRPKAKCGSYKAFAVDLYICTQRKLQYKSSHTVHVYIYIYIHIYIYNVCADK